MRKQSHLWKYIIPVLSLAACYVIWWLVEDNRSDYKLNQLKKEMEDRREVFFEKENPNHQFSEEETAELTDFLITNMQVHEGAGGKEYQKFIAYFKAWENSEAKAKAIADSITKIRGDFNPKSLRHIPDWKTIQTDSLWYYVTGLLKLRNDLPWCKKIPWEDFLEHISPYRISNEPLSMG